MDRYTRKLFLHPALGANKQNKNIGKKVTNATITERERERDAHTMILIIISFIK